MTRVWHQQGDYQLGHIDGEWVVLARGGSYANKRGTFMPLRRIATCADRLDAERIVEALLRPPPPAHPEGNPRG